MCASAEVAALESGRWKGITITASTLWIVVAYESNEAEANPVGSRLGQLVLTGQINQWHVASTHLTRFFSFVVVRVFFL